MSQHLEYALEVLALSIDRLIHKVEIMSAQLDTLTAAVAAEDTVIASLLALLNGLAAQIAAIPADDSAALAALAADIQAKTALMSAAVLANTPAAPVVPAPAPVTPSV